MSEPTKDKDGWEVTAKRFVGYIDIMGFKDMVARSKHEPIYEIDLFGKSKFLQQISQIFAEKKFFVSAIISEISGKLF